MKEKIQKVLVQCRLSISCISSELKVVRNFLIVCFVLSSTFVSAQKDLILKKDSSDIRCKILSQTSAKYKYAFINTKNKVEKTSILKIIVDTVIYNKYDSNLIADKAFGNMPAMNDEEDKSLKAYQFSFGIGLNVSNVLEFNPPSGVDKKSFSVTSALDLGLNYFKEGKAFAMTNELHWTLAIQKSGLSSAAHFQRATDDLSTLHDFSFAMNKSKWNFNLIGKFNSSVFTIYDGDYFKDYNNNGKIQALLSPYQVTISPGIKYQPNKYFRLSISPYSFSLYGLRSQKIANTGFYTQTFDANNNYDRFVYKQLGAELNIWYDRKLKKWLELQYRFGISSDYFSKIAKNGLMDGLFITKFKLIKNVSLSHRAILRGDIGQKPFKPFYSQTILLSFSKSF